MKHEFYAFEENGQKRSWRFECSRQWLAKHDNGHSVSIGFRVPEDVSEKQLKHLNAVEVDREEWKHSGCQSSCIRRGGKECRW